MCILFVDDEALVRGIVANRLVFYGFEVNEAHTGDHAACLIDNPSQVFSLLITNIHMPGQRNGIEVARLIRLNRPTLPIIYLIGRPDELYLAGPLGPREAPVRKPYTPAHLLQTMRTLGVRVEHGSEV